MLVCSVSQLRRRAAIAADLAEAATALDAATQGAIVFAALVDDPASVNDRLDAFLGQIMAEAATAAATVNAGLVYAAAIVAAASAADVVNASTPIPISAGVAEAAAASSTQDATVSSAALVLDGIASLTGAWSLSRDLRTSFAGSTRYTKSGTAIITLEDQSGNNRDFTDGGNTARRPVETTAFPAGVLCADFDGVQTSLDTSALISSFITNSSGAFVVSVIIDAVSTNSATPYSNHGIIADTGTFLGLHARNLSGVTFIVYNWDGTADQTTATGTTATPYVLMWRHHGGNIYVSINGGAEISVASGNTTTISAFLRLGNSGGVGTFCNMKFAEGFCTSDGSQTAALATAIANMKAYIGAGGGGGGGTTTFNGTSSNITLSNGNLTVTHPNTSAAGSASSDSRTDGKFYFEVTSSVSVSSGNSLGVMSAGDSVTAAPSAGGSLKVAVLMGSSSSPVYYPTATNSGKDLGAAAVADVWAAAIDIHNGLAWFRKNGGNWNADAAANPATGTGGVAFSARATYAPYVSFAGGANSTDVLTSNFGASAFIGTPPSGFGNWVPGI